VLPSCPQLVVSKRTTIGGLRIRIRPDDGKLHSQTPRFAVEGDGPHIVIHHRKNNIAHAPVPDGKRYTRLLVFLDSVAAAGYQYFGNDDENPMLPGSRLRFRMLDLI
jgi:hypothetical protein